MNGNEGYWGGGISIISQNFPKSSSIHLIPLFPKQALTVRVGVDVDACGYDLYMKMTKQMVPTQTICFAIFSTNEN
jgi:hypothetical protein